MEVVMHSVKKILVTKSDVTNSETYYVLTHNKRTDETEELQLILFFDEGADKKPLKTIHQKVYNFKHKIKDE